MPTTSLTPPLLMARARELGHELACQAAEHDRLAKANMPAFEHIRRLRLGAMRVPRRYGGANGEIGDVVALMIALAKGDPSVAQSLLPHFVFVERTLLMGTPAQITAYLDQVAQGKLVGGASAELGGAFRGEVRTLLSRHGDAYRLNGLKHYSTGALMGDLLKVLAVDEQGETVLAVVPADRPGIIRHDDWQGMGQRGTLSGRTELNDVLVDEAEVMRAQRWQTERHHTGAASQILHCAIEVGIAMAALDDAAAWARGGVRPVKESGVSRGRDDPYLLHYVGQIAAQTHGAHALVLAAAAQIELAARARFAGAGAQEIERLAVEASIATAEAKVIATEAALFAGQTLFDVGGASTTLRKHDFDRHWRNARTHTTHDPVAYKYRAIGDYRLNHRAPPIGYGY
ncbi:acyl-CoA dehydrogenase family protein [Sodalis sp. RH22]|uniref:acyl-CoA dehydrogenase family protein n=1 Tax=unclassified Sodalis (in: enterobacteria) TaxID=2636512 RepID=UPI0039B4648D